MTGAALHAARIAAPLPDPASAAFAAAHSAADRVLPEWVTRTAADPAVAFALKIVGGLLLVIVGLRLASWLANLQRGILLRIHVDRILAEFLRNVTYAAVLAIIVISALQVTGFPTTSLLTALGAAGLAVGLALKDSLSHIAAGVVLIVLRPFRVGDSVNIAGQDGVVEGIFIFQTRLHTFDNRELTFMNGAVIGAPIFNYSQRAQRRCDITLLVELGTDPQALFAAARAAIAADERIVAEPAPYLALSDINERGIVLAIQVWTSTAAIGVVRSDLLAECLRRFAEAKIELVHAFALAGPAVAA